MKVTAQICVVCDGEVFEFERIEGTNEAEFKDKLVTGFLKAAKTVQQEWDGWPE